MIRAANHDDIPALAEVLLDAIDSGASVNFMSGFTRLQAEQFFSKCLSDPLRVVMVAVEKGTLEGTAQLIFDTPPNQPHRAELQKMLVHRRARQRGIGRSLFAAVCEEARALGRTVLNFDTAADGSGERLYLACGATKIGVIPHYALYPDGTFCDTSIFYKLL